MVQASLDGSSRTLPLAQTTDESDLDLLHSPRGPTQIIPERSPASWNWEFESTAVAGGECRCLCGCFQGGNISNHLTPSHRLLLAQIQVGFRKVKQYRDLMETNYELSTLALTDP